jgi:predicted CoA-substrate-specific enzyme activase
MNGSYFIGIDVGASTTKAVVIDQNKDILGHAIVDSGADFEAAAEAVYKQSQIHIQSKPPDECFIISTGYGRKNIPFAHTTKTEISCHAKGSYFHFPSAHTLIDIGGQDSKIIKINSAGKRTSFKMNRKCAAGTGAFLEEIANRLKLRIEDLNGLAEKAENDIQLGSYCTVFTATEILAKIRENVAIQDIVKGIFNSVIKRAFEMDLLEGDIVMSGGVAAHNPYFIRMFEEKLDKQIFVPPLPQLTGALGAALYALEQKGGQNA